MTVSILRKAGAGAAALLLVFALATPADAGPRHRHHGAALAAGIFGLAAGALIVGAATREHHYHDPYYGPPRRYRRPSRHYGPPPAYGPPARVVYAPAPWTPEWYSYCHSKYRSFDRRSGTYQPYRGRRRLCR